MSEMQHTKDLGIFKILEGNRPINPYHLKKLKKAIEKDNELSLHPIIVNKNFYIIDGQHRHQAALELGLELFYIKSDTITEEHLIESNVNQRTWEVENYIDYFAIREKREDYIKLKNMIVQSKIKPKALLTLCLGSVSISLLEFLKTGKFKFPSLDNQDSIFNLYLDFVAYTKDKHIKPQGMFSNHNFTRAFRWLTKTAGFDSQTFFKKLDMKWFELKPQRSAEDWYSLLISVYNFRNQNRLEVEDEKR